MRQPQPGDYFLTQIGGTLGLVIRILQGLTGDWSRYTHAGIVLDDETVIAAQPGGARIDPLRSVFNIRSRNVAFSANDWLSDEDRAEIVARARALEGTPYNFLDYVLLALLAFGIKPEWLRRRVHDTGHLICSQLVDEVYAEVGVELFADDRLSGDVTPGDLAHVGTITHYNTGPHQG